MIRRFHTTPTTPEEQREADFHRRIAPLLSKKDQGRVMGEYRAIMAAEYPELISPSPKQLELQFESEPNKVKPTTFMRDADYSALEARVYAEMAKDGRLSEYLEQHHSKPEQQELPLDSCGSQP